MPVTCMTTADIAEVQALVNAAYRGEASRAGWTTEADLIAGHQRIDAASLQTMLQHDNETVLLLRNDDGTLEGCVYLQQQPQGMYLGMLSVWPQQQAQGTGKRLMQAAEDFARSKQVHRIFMSVITVRTELIAWYQRRGYSDTGERKPFPNNPVFGTPLQPLEFMILEKELKATC
ncbi:GNAT family N-acetyltransferase [Phnomibacter ginsenosidimutans]|uniref:GNAT family N-acetyltransferase n=1 Tax=Phnomibacter ginsenosidimutans TaxID=2676868 RepID=A0A6I6GVQ3_9BACT|nr:GNAT family N-acetyltransferase [Phnomibacter ginsenosidimutans]QGW26781.1 GNAT family N-acetyltransferase [Phnomibacter ginsenosidimutans]